jgi:hypothetical protein
VKRILVCSAFALIAGLGATVAAESNDQVVRVGKHVYALHIPAIPNSPFTASEDLEIQQVLADGTSIAQRMLLRVGRDASGRTHQEAGYFKAESNPGPTKLEAIVLFDPTTGIRTTIDPERRTASQVVTGRREKSGVAQSGNQQDFGVEMLDGESVHHTASSRTIEVGSQGNDRPIVITDEVWRSTDLDVNLMMRHEDPREGTVTMKLTELQRGNPSPDFFQIPIGYQILTSAIGTSSSTLAPGSNAERAQNGTAPK